MSTHDGLFHVRDLLDDVGRRVGLASAVKTGMVFSQWPEIVGTAVASHAQPSSLKGGVLRVRADSPGWATEIGYLGAQIKQAVNDKVGSELVAEVKVWTGPGPALPPARAKPADRPVQTSPEDGPDDPLSALERARKAWSRRSRGSK